MNEDITKSLEKLIEKHSYLTGSFIKKAINEELDNRNIGKNNNNGNIVESYESLVNWIMVELGHPVIEINVAEEHYRQAIYSAVELWWQHHYDGSYIEYQAIKLTQSMIDSNEIKTTSNIESVVSVSVISSNNSNEPVTYNNLDWKEYETGRSYNMSRINSHTFEELPLSGMLALELQLNNMQHMFKKNVVFRYHRYENKVKFKDSTLKKLSPGSLILLEVYKNVDEIEVVNMFNDIWIKAYSKQKVKQSWGNILKAIKNVPLLGGSTSSGDELYSEATEEIEKLELELIEKYEHPPMFYWG